MTILIMWSPVEAMADVRLDLDDRAPPIDIVTSRRMITTDGVMSLIKRRTIGLGIIQCQDDQTIIVKRAVIGIVNGHVTTIEKEIAAAIDQSETDPVAITIPGKMTNTIIAKSAGSEREMSQPAIRRYGVDPMTLMMTLTTTMQDRSSHCGTNHTMTSVDILAMIAIGRKTMTPPIRALSSRRPGAAIVSPIRSRFIRAR